jgi:meiotically up-regulated gene 157 (Mug157) protein
MVWSGFRPSDDACKFGYLVPANMFAAVILEHVARFARDIYHDQALADAAEQLRADIQFGIETYAIVQHPRFGRMYAYETDGYGNTNLMDDANVPSLLSLPYLGCCATNDPLYQATRAFILSNENPYYSSGRYAQGIGSPHTPPGYIWPIALIMQGLTSTDADEQHRLIRMLISTTANTNYMHESFQPDHPEDFTRSWFAWANSLFGEFIVRWALSTSLG